MGVKDFGQFQFLASIHPRSSTLNPKPLAVGPGPAGGSLRDWLASMKSRFGSKRPTICPHGDRSEATFREGGGGRGGGGGGWERWGGRYEG